MTSDYKVRLRPLEREDLRFVHQLDNNASVMRYWFEEPYEAFVELSDLYDKHIHDQSERRFVVECDGENAGLVELVEINHVQSAGGISDYYLAGVPGKRPGVTRGQTGDGLRIYRTQSL